MLRRPDPMPLPRAAFVSSPWSAVFRTATHHSREKLLEHNYLPCERLWAGSGPLISPFVTKNLFRPARQQCTGPVGGPGWPMAWGWPAARCWSADSEPDPVRPPERDRARDAAGRDLTQPGQAQLVLGPPRAQQ